MPAHAHTRLLLLAAVAAALLMLAGVAGAQEGDDPLSRYDSRSTRQLAQEHEENQKRAEEIEDEMDALEDAGEYGDEWDALNEEESELADGTDLANALGDARLSDIEAAPLPDASEPKSEELRRKAQSADALQAWATGATGADIDINSRLYSMIGEGEAGQLADVWREKAGAIELAENSEEVAQEKREAAEDAAAKPETQGAAPGDGDGGEKPVEDPEPKPEAAPEEVPTENTGTGIGGFLGDVNIVPILVFALLAAGGIFALSRASGMSVRGFFSPAMASVKTKPKKPALKTRKKVAAGTSKTRPSTPRKAERDDLEGPEPEARDEEAERLQQWFEKEAPEPRPKPENDAADDDEPPV